MCYWVWLGYIVYTVVYLTACLLRGAFAGFCSYIYIYTAFWVVVVTRGFTLAVASWRKRMILTHLQPLTLQMIYQFSVRTSRLRWPHELYKYCISLFQCNYNIYSLRLRTDAGSFSDASHGGSTHTKDMHVRLSENDWEATISSKDLMDTW